MTARIGADGLGFFGDPRPELLIDVARVQPEPGGEWVHLGRLGFRSTQRLQISDLRGGVAMATWPAELVPQARYLYGRGLGPALVAAAIERGWTVEPSPHIAYHTAPPGRRLYMRPAIAPRDYVARWEDEDALRRVGSHSRQDVEHELWPWLKESGFADDGDDARATTFSRRVSAWLARAYAPGPSVPARLDVRRGGRARPGARGDDPRRVRRRVRQRA